MFPFTNVMGTFHIAQLFSFFDFIHILCAIPVSLYLIVSYGQETNKQHCRPHTTPLDCVDRNGLSVFQTIPLLEHTKHQQNQSVVSANQATPLSRSTIDSIDAGLRFLSQTPKSPSPKVNMYALRTIVHGPLTFQCPMWPGRPS